MGENKKFRFVADKTKKICYNKKQAKTTHKVRAFVRKKKGEKMKVERIIATLDAIKENKLTDETKLVWINEVEGRVECEIRKKKATEYRNIVGRNDELSVPEPYSRIYILYLAAMIAFTRGEYDLYGRTLIEYETAFSEYAKYVIRNR